MLLYPWNAASNVLRGNEHGRVVENAGRNGDPYRLRREGKLLEHGSVLLRELLRVRMLREGQKAAV